MNVLMISHDQALYESNSRSEELARKYGTLVDSLHIIVFARAHKGLKNRTLSQNVFVYPTNAKTKLGQLVKAYRLGKKIRDPHLVTAQDPFEAGLVGYFLSRKHKIPLQLQEHGDFFSTYHWRGETILNRLRYILGLFLLRRADCIRVVAKRIKETLLEKGISEERITVLPIRTPIEQLVETQPSLDLHKKYPEAGVVFLTMARFVKQKNLPLLIDAFHRVHEKEPRAHLIIVGEGPEKKRLLHQVKECNLGDVVHFEPWTSDAASYLKTADIYILPSNYEGWGRVIIEAMACGLPVIMTNVGCANEVMRDGEHGFVVPIGDADALAKAMNTLALDEGKRKMMSDAAKKTALNMPSEKNYLESYKKQWEKCLQQNLKK